MPYASVNDIRISDEEQRRGDPLLLLHGGIAAIDLRLGSWARLMPTVAARDRAIHRERRGRG